ncbi:MAG: PAS domain-containing protein [Bryobacterales bacterium]|nr:PAS domain-containing protein [Bryobacterales bacterium]
MRRYRGSDIRKPAGLIAPADSPESSSEFVETTASQPAAASGALATGPFERLVKLSNEVTGIGVAIFDEHIRFIEINPMLAGLNGLPKEAHAGRPLADVVPNLGEKLTEIAHRALDQRNPIKDLKFSARVPLERGPLRDWLASFFPIGLGGGIAGLAQTLIEVTDQMHVETALAELALGTSEPHDELTTREADVLALIGRGKTTKEIAALLGISVETVSNHRKHLCRKLDLHSSAELVAFAATTTAAGGGQRSHSACESNAL